MPRRCAAASRRDGGDSGATPTPAARGRPARPLQSACLAGRPAGRLDPAGQAPIDSPSGSGLREVWVKNDAANPTHSFKDRVVAVASARARELGFNALACASTGNLGNAVAAQGGGARPALLRLHPSRSRGAEDPRHEHLRHEPRHGARQLRRRQSPCTELSAEHDDWAFVNINMRPYYSEGSKTVAYEIVEQLGWELPDRVVAPIASGSLFTKINKGLQGMDRARPRERTRSR